MSTTSTIGDVIVVAGNPADDNPYTAPRISGEERAELLAAFRDGADVADTTFWHAPAAGGAFRITSPDQVNWSGMRR